MVKRLLILMYALLGLGCQTKGDKKVQTISYNELSDLLGNDIQLLDVRTPVEFGKGHIPGAENADIRNMENFREKTLLLDKEKPVYLYCQAGIRSKTAAKKLREMGFEEILDYTKGYREWASKK